MKTLNFGVDLGLRRDRTAIVGTYHDSGIVKLAHVKTFKAPPRGEVSVSDVEDYLSQLNRSFRNSKFIIDPWQAVSSMQRLKKTGMRIEEFTFSGKNWTQMTQTLFGLFKDRRIKIFDHQELVKELLNAKVVQKSYGYRLDHESGQHNDHVVALAMSALYSSKAPAAPLWYGIA